MNYRGLQIILCLLLATPTLAQNRYAIYLKDKANSPYTISQPSAFLSQRAITRRTKNNIPLSPQDLPINPTYKTTIAASGAKVLLTSKWLNALVVEATPAQVATISTLTYVERTELVAPGKQPAQAYTPNVTNTPTTRTNTGTITATQLNMLGIDAMHAQNIKGNGVIIAVLDSGFPAVNTAAPFNHLLTKIIDQYNFVNLNNNPFVNDSHGTEVLSIIAALKADQYTGAAPEASFCLYVTEHVPDEYRIEEYQWLSAAERADSVGADIINASLGYNTFDNPAMDYTKSQLDGNTAIVTQAASIAASKGIIVAVSAGNEGNNTWQTITPPADAENILAVGSVTSAGIKSSFSSTGPTADNRIKPDVAALGSSTATISTNGTIKYVSGTSEATPLISGLAAGILQQFPQIPIAEVLTAIKQTASQAAEPNNTLGYGIPNYQRIVTYLNFPVSTEKAYSQYVFFPNPVNQKKLMVKEKNELHFTFTSITIINSHGVEVKTWQPTTQEKVIAYQIDLHQLPSGTYILQVNTGTSTFVQKIILP
ncbi:MAG: S8 family serine peptidase [Chryseotalea sp.]